MSLKKRLKQLEDKSDTTNLAVRSSVFFMKAGAEAEMVIGYVNDEGHSINRFEGEDINAFCERVYSLASSLNASIDMRKNSVSFWHPQCLPESSTH